MRKIATRGHGRGQFKESRKDEWEDVVQVQSREKWTKECRKSGAARGERWKSGREKKTEKSKKKCFTHCVNHTS